jgi:segregation and condensation protein A
MEQIVDLILDKKNISWQTILYELVRSEQMDPWDLDISELAKKFIEIIKRLKEADFQLTGKMLLASAILLKIKSVSLVDDYNEFNSMVDDLQKDDSEEFFDNPDYNDSFDEDYSMGEEQDSDEITELETKPKLVQRKPKPRLKKISIYDLIQGLEKALEVKTRKEIKKLTNSDLKKLEIPKKKIDISVLVSKLFSKILDFFKGKNKKLIFFEDLVESKKKEDIILTFLPLLYLDADDKINLSQDSNFSQIKIYLNSKEEK